MTARFRRPAGLLIAGLLLSAPPLNAQDHGSGHGTGHGTARDGEKADAAPADAAPARAAPLSDADRMAAQRPTYPLQVCIVSGEPLEAMQARTDVLRAGRLVSFCCNDCVKEFDKTPDKFHKQLDDAVIAAQAPGYPLDTCPMSGEPLKDARHVVVGTRLIEVCCNMCKKDVAADPAAALAAIDGRIMDKQAADYPLDACVVDGKPLGDKPVRNLHGLTLVEFCSAECAARFRAEPPGFLKKLEDARAERKARPDKGGK
jgi:YHS domain-containing protein